MIALLLSSLVAPRIVTPALDSPAVLAAPEDPSVDAQIAAAGKDVGKLLELANSLTAANQPEPAKKVYKKILEIDANHEAAHKALNHQYYDKKWFESLTELSKYKRDEAAKMKAKGLVRWKEEWVAEADLPFLNMGWTKDEQGAWQNPVEAARAKQVAEWKAAGYQFRADDNSWVAPADNAQWAALQWKCGEQWLDMAKANEYHAQIEHPWELAGEHFVAWTTCDWEGGNKARWHADKAHADLVRLFGVQPKSKPHFIVLNSLEQYNRAAGGNPPLIPETEGFSSLHGAYFADVFFDDRVKPPQYMGAGVSYWDRKDEKLASWGPCWLRWAAAQSFVEAIDPSWNAVGARIAGGEFNAAPESSVPFWTEKKIPRWLRYGAAAYVERFMQNPDIAPGADPWNLRGFAFTEIKKSGGLRKLDGVFEFKLGLDDAAGSSHLYNEAGLLVSFLLDGAGDDKDLAKKHEAFKAALKSGSKADVTAAVEALQKSLAKNEKDIKKFAGL